ncbi:MAG TPA: S8 family serine peptidase [Planctomycetota bacterium]|nr:S8 family serine peptidase [Planctomycetota bacterium]
MSSVACPICGLDVDPRWLARHASMEARVAGRLRDEHPAWSREDGACPRCVARALEEIGGDDGAPYGRGGEILSIGARLHAEPTFAGRGVTVAFLDSDFVLHPELARPRRRVVAYVDARRNPARVVAAPPAPYVGSWHGTMTAGSAFGSGTTSSGRFAGIAPSARLVLVRIASDRMRVGEREIVRGMRWVLSRHRRLGIRVVNLSVGGDEPERSSRNVLDRLVARAVGEGIVVVASSGNRPDRPPVAPASAPEAITVGGIDDFGRGSADGVGDVHLWPSTHGPTLDGIDKPDLLAPSNWLPAPMVPGTPQWDEAAALFRLEALGDRKLPAALARRFDHLYFPREILSLPTAAVRGALAMRRAERKYIAPTHQHVDGTSFAAAIVSAVAAQMLEANPALSPGEVKEILVRTARPIAGVPHEMQGGGVIQAGLAVRVAERWGKSGAIALRASPEIDGDVVRWRFLDGSRRLRGVEVWSAVEDWRPLAMRRTAPGVWTFELPRPAAGRWAYQLRASDGRWLEDPANPRRKADGFGGWANVLEVGTTSATSRRSATSQK